MLKDTKIEPFPLVHNSYKDITKPELKSPIDDGTEKQDETPAELTSKNHS